MLTVLVVLSPMCLILPVAALSLVLWLRWAGFLIIALVLFLAASIGRRVVGRLRRGPTEPPTACLVCGQSLADLRVEDDGCVTCTECAAAWQVRSPRRGRTGPDRRLAKGRCPSCAYALGDVPTQDGLTTCPECGAQWRV